MLATLLTGRPPFESEAVPTTLDRVSRAEYTLPPTLSSSAQSLIRSMLSKNPRDRPSASQVLKHEWMIYGEQKRLGQNLSLSSSMKEHSDQVFFNRSGNSGRGVVDMMELDENRYRNNGPEELHIGGNGI